MVSFHRVREHFRKNTPDGVKEYTRGQGSRSVPYSGSFGGSMSSRPETAEKKPGFFEGLKAKATGKIEMAQKKIAEEKRAKEEGQRFSENIQGQIEKEEAENERVRRNEEFVAKTTAEAQTKARLGKHYKLKGALRSGAKYVFSTTKQTLATPAKPRRTKSRKTTRKRPRKEPSLFANW